MTNVLAKLKKLFPLSFMFCKNIWKLLLGAVIYLGINEVAVTVLSFVSIFVALPLALFMYPIIGWIAAIILFPIVLVLIVLNLAVSFAITLVSLYTKMGIVVSVIAFITGEDEEEVPAEEAVEAVADASAEETEQEIEEIAE